MVRFALFENERTGSIVKCSVLSNVNLYVGNASLMVFFKTKKAKHKQKVIGKTSFTQSLDDISNKTKGSFKPGSNQRPVDILVTLQSTLIAH